jgi:hypothetical protein
MALKQPSVVTEFRAYSSIPLSPSRTMKRLIFLLVPSVLAAQAQPTLPNVKPGWRWSMDTVRTVVSAVRAGQSLQPNEWPNGARVAVLLSFDVDNETVALRFDDPNPGALSQRQYGSREGLGRVLKLLDPRVDSRDERHAPRFRRARATNEGDRRADPDDWYEAHRLSSAELEHEPEYVRHPAGPRIPL